MTRWWGWPAARRSSSLKTPPTPTPSTGRWPRTASCTTSTTSWSTAGGWSSTRERSAGSPQAAGLRRPSPSTTKRRDCEALRGGRGRISGKNLHLFTSSLFYVQLFSAATIFNLFIFYVIYKPLGISGDFPQWFDLNGDSEWWFRPKIRCIIINLLFKVLQNSDTYFY